MYQSKLSVLRVLCSVLIGMAVLAGTEQRAWAQGWPAVYEPTILMTLNLEMDPGDWITIQNDETFDIEVPAMFWSGDEEHLLVNVRRKSGDPMNNDPAFTKVSIKIDVNDLVSGQRWNDLTKLSLENGDDADVVSEGFAWYLHKIASGPEGYGYDHPAGYASWITLIINGVDTGVYVNVEQRDKQFLRNRGLYIQGQTWLYKVSDINQSTLKVGNGSSPTYDILCYSPFQRENRDCPTPDAATLAAELPGLIDMRAMMSMAAVNVFTGNPDAMFTHGKNFYFADFAAGRRRMHFPWDQDSVLTNIEGDIYGTRSSYSEILLSVPEFRAEFSDAMNDLVCGPFKREDLHAFLDSVEPVLTAALDADPNNRLNGPASEHFDSIRNWVSGRLLVVASQIENFQSCNPDCYADCNGDNALNIQDILCYLNLFSSRDPAADCNGDGTINTLDFLCFLNSFEAGCP